MAKLLKNRCTEYSSYDVQIFHENIPEEPYDPDSVIISIFTPDAIIGYWECSYTPNQYQILLANPINLTIKGLYNERFNKNKKSEIRHLAVMSNYGARTYVREFSYWIDGAFIRPEDSGLMRTLAISDLNVGTEGGEPTLT